LLHEGNPGPSQTNKTSKLPYGRGGSLVGAYLTDERFPQLIVYLASLAAGLVCAAGNIFNDILDLESDKINHPFRPLVTGEINVSAALTVSIVLGVFSILISLLAGYYATLAVLVSLLLLFFYSLKIKKLPFVGNFLIAALGHFQFCLAPCL